MRRIIERKVTVVTTTTWTISWQDAPPHSSSQADPAPETVSDTDALPALTAPEPSVVIETKEADPESAKRSNETKSP
jgi:hypothetical protein